MVPLVLQERRVQRAPLETLVLLDLRVPKENQEWMAQLVRLVRKAPLVRMVLLVNKALSVPPALKEV